MPTLNVPGSAPPETAKPKESRRWLKPRVPKEQLYRLAPRRAKPTRLGALSLGDRVRVVICAWWAWFTAALLMELLGLRFTGLVLGAVAFALYQRLDKD